MARKNAKPAHGGKRTGAGRPARSDDGPTKSFTLRLSATERETLAALAEKLELSESDVLRRGLTLVAGEAAAAARRRS